MTEISDKPADVTPPVPEPAPQEPEKLTDLLLSQPGIIFSEEMSLLKLSQAQAEDNLKINEIEAVVKSETAMNLNLKNEDQRRASLNLTLKDNVLYQGLKKGIPIRDLEIRQAQAHISFQRDMLRSYLAIACIGK